MKLNKNSSSTHGKCHLAGLAGRCVASFNQVASRWKAFWFQNAKRHLPRERCV